MILDRLYNRTAVATPSAPLEPLLFTRLLKEKVWGGRRLAQRLGLELPFAGPLGETWELSDYPGEETRVRSGALQGRSLRELMEDHGPGLLGRSRPTREGRFPLLVKLIEAAEDLSVQIHPPDGPKSPTGVGKTEAWYVLESAPGAEVICGLRPGTSRERFEREAGDARVRAHLHGIPVAAGDCVLVPAGMTHAIRAGVILCEIQQTSDVTFRMYDWDRLGLDGRPRQTHLLQALQVVDYGLGPGRAVRAELPPPTNGAAVAPLVACPYFELQAVAVTAPTVHEPEGLARVLAVVGGGGWIEAVGGQGGPLELAFGDVVLVPGSLDSIQVAPAAGGLRLIEGVAL